MIQGKQKARCIIPGDLCEGAKQSLRKFRSLFVRKEPQNGNSDQVVRKDPTGVPPNKRPDYWTTRIQNQIPLRRLDGTKNPTRAVPLKENSPTTSEPPPESAGQKQLKGEPSRMERSPQVFSESPRCLEYTL